MKPLNFAKIAIVGLALMTLVGSAIAQQGGGNPPPPPPQGDPRIFVVKMSTVQEHLQLTAEQIQRINDLRPPGPGGPGGGGPGGGGPGGGGPGGGGPGGGGNGQPPQDPLANILNQNQLKRLHQLTLQFNAPMSVMWRNVGPQLQLTEDQRHQIDEIIRTNVPPPNPQQPPNWNEMQQAKAHAWELVRAVFTQAQAQKWNQLAGPAFTNWVQPPPPPGG